MGESVEAEASARLKTVREVETHGLAALAATEAPPKPNSQIETLDDVTKQLLTNGTESKDTGEQLAPSPSRGSSGDVVLPEDDSDSDAGSGFGEHKDVDAMMDDIERIQLPEVPDGLGPIPVDILRKVRAHSHELDLWWRSQRAHLFDVSGENALLPIELLKAIKKEHMAPSRGVSRVPTQLDEFHKSLLDMVTSITRDPKAYETTMKAIQEMMDPSSAAAPPVTDEDTEEFLNVLNKTITPGKPPDEIARDIENKLQQLDPKLFHENLLEFDKSAGKFRLPENAQPRKRITRVFGGDVSKNIQNTLGIIIDALSRRNDASRNNANGQVIGMVLKWAESYQSLKNSTILGTTMPGLTWLLSSHSNFHDISAGKFKMTPSVQEITECEPAVALTCIPEIRLAHGELFSTAILMGTLYQFGTEIRELASAGPKDKTSTRFQMAVMVPLEILNKHICLRAAFSGFKETFQTQFVAVDVESAFDKLSETMLTRFDKPNAKITDNLTVGEKNILRNVITGLAIREMEKACRGEHRSFPQNFAVQPAIHALFLHAMYFVTFHYTRSWLSPVTIARGVGALFTPLTWAFQKLFSSSSAPAVTGSVGDVNMNARDIDSITNISGLSMADPTDATSEEIITHLVTSIQEREDLLWNIWSMTALPDLKQLYHILQIVSVDPRSIAVPEMNVLTIFEDKFVEKMEQMIPIKTFGWGPTPHTVRDKNILEAIRMKILTSVFLRSMSYQSRVRKNDRMAEVEEMMLPIVTPSAKELSDLKKRTQIATYKGVSLCITDIHTKRLQSIAVVVLGIVYNDDKKEKVQYLLLSLLAMWNVIRTSEERTVKKTVLQILRIMGIGANDSDVEDNGRVSAPPIRAQIETFIKKESQTFTNLENIYKSFVRIKVDHRLSLFPDTAFHGRNASIEELCNGLANMAEDVTLDTVNQISMIKYLIQKNTESSDWEALSVIQTQFMMDALFLTMCLIVWRKTWDETEIPLLKVNVEVGEMDVMDMLGNITVMGDMYDDATVDASNTLFGAQMVYWDGFLGSYKSGSGVQVREWVTEAKNWLTAAILELHFVEKRIASAKSSDQTIHFWECAKWSLIESIRKSRTSLFEFGIAIKPVELQGASRKFSVLHNIIETIIARKKIPQDPVLLLQNIRGPDADFKEKLNSGEKLLLYNELGKLQEQGTLISFLLGKLPDNPASAPPPSRTLMEVHPVKSPLRWLIMHQ